MIESVDREARPQVVERHSNSISSVEQMVAARQALGLGVSDIAAQLGMATRQIEALERGDWKALPGQAFVRGALRAYGKTIGADIDPLLATLGGQVRAPELRASASLEAPMPRGGSMGFDSGGSFSRMAWILVGVAAVIAMAFYFSRSLELRDPATTSAFSPLRSAERAGSQGGSDSSTGSVGSGSGGSVPGSGAGDRPEGGGSIARLAPLTPLTPLTSATAPSSDALGAGRNQAAGSDDQAGSTPAADSASPATGQAARASIASAGSSAAARPSSTGPAQAAATPGLETLRLSFERESWVDIREAGGTVLLFGIQAAGSTRELSGRKPFTFTLGNAQYVTLERGGKPVDLGARSRQGVARFTLD